MRVDAGWKIAAADLRAATARFATLDYADGDTPRLYAGELVRLEDLRLRGLREPEP